MKNIITRVRSEGSANLEARAEGYRFTLRLIAAGHHPATGIESPPRKVKVELKTEIGVNSYYIPERLLRPTDKVCGELLTGNWGTRMPSGTCKTVVFEALTLSSAVDAAVTRAQEIDTDAYAHQIARAAAIAAEDAAYAIRLAS